MWQAEAVVLRKRMVSAVKALLKFKKNTASRIFINVGTGYLVVLRHLAIDVF